ncbi:tight adherence protein B [Mycobacterium sp. OAS707]|uniref:type II secretion system F family protein n=1 Tax=Mycobacterium sp. OAS707 TaxID=2663822 RepID=UPI001788E867|nr:tight adherence protein B [Mycobacterium sp. OAS707]
MSAALLSLAAALLILPAPTRGRLDVLGFAVTRRRRPSVLPCAGVAAALAVVLPAGLVAATAILGVTWWVRRRRRIREKRRAAESAALQGALEVLVGELRVGAHPVAAFGVAASEVDSPVAESMRAVAARARLGADVPAGLRSVSAGSALPAHWERLGVCWQLAQDHGLSIAPLMQTAQRDVVEREQFAARVDAGLTGARTTAFVLAGLPLLGVGLGELIGAAPLSFLLSGGVGGWLLVIGVALVCVGMLWSDRITAQATI